jgi:dCTP deaminase
MIKSDRWIKEMAKKHEMISPFVEEKVKKGNISYGLSSYGYDTRLSDEFLIPKFKNKNIIDPKNADLNDFEKFSSTECIIEPNSFILGTTIEYFKIPKDVLCLCVGKSTYARCGVTVNITPLEPEWEGNITIQIQNTSPFPVKIYAHEGIAQILFFQSDELPLASYKDTGGKYQNQKGITPAKT